MNALVAVCEKDVGKHVAVPSEDQMSLELEAKDEKKANTDDDVIDAVLAVCENEEEKRVAALSQDQLGDEIGAKIKAGEIDASVRLGHLWMEIHARALKKNSA